MKRSDFFKKVVSVIYKDEKITRMSIKGILEYIQKDNDEIIDKWVKSRYSDFDIYNSEKYISELINCYHHCSKNTCGNLLKFFEKNNIDFNNFSFFDDYNGIGLTTLHLMIFGDIKNISYYNDVTYQTNLFNYFCDMFNVNANRVEHRNSKYDVVVSAEVVEHYKNPLNYIKTISNMVNDKGYLVLSTGFNRKIYVGHFPNYTVNDREISRFQVYRHIKKFLINNGYILAQRCFNSKPIIYQKVR